jgi:hypothetical protein
MPVKTRHKVQDGATLTLGTGLVVDASSADGICVYCYVPSTITNLQWSGSPDGGTTWYASKEDISVLFAGTRTVQQFDAPMPGLIKLDTLGADIVVDVELTRKIKGLEADEDGDY